MAKNEQCRYCNGTGKQICYSCKGEGSKVGFKPGTIQFMLNFPETKKCNTCNGTGETKCLYCNGTGKAK